MKTDIEIAQEAVMEPITKVAESMALQQMTWNFTENTRQSFPKNFYVRSRIVPMEN